ALLCVYARCVYVFFFFSSRRRHTRSKRDWSSDVCSSDLSVHDAGRIDALGLREVLDFRECGEALTLGLVCVEESVEVPIEGRGRSEERRVGKECRSGWATDDGRSREAEGVLGRRMKHEEA